MVKKTDFFFLLLQFQGVGKVSLKNCFIIPNQWIQKNSVNLSVLKLEQRYLHQIWVLLNCPQGLALFSALMHACTIILMVRVWGKQMSSN